MAERFLSDVRSILDSQGTIDAIVLIKTVGCTRATVDEDTVRRARDFHMDNLRQMDFINNPVDSHLIRAFHGVKQLLRAITENSRPELALVLILGLLQLFWDLYRIPEVPPALDLVDAAAWAATVSTDLHLRISAAAAAAPKAKAAPKPKPKPKPKAKANPMNYNQFVEMLHGLSEDHLAAIWLGMVHERATAEENLHTKVAWIVNLCAMNEAWGGVSQQFAENQVPAPALMLAGMLMNNMGETMQGLVRHVVWASSPERGAPEGEGGYRMRAVGILAAAFNFIRIYLPDGPLTFEQEPNLDGVLLQMLEANAAALHAEAHPNFPEPAAEPRPRQRPSSPAAPAAPRRTVSWRVWRRC